VHKKPANFSWN